RRPAARRRRGRAAGSRGDRFEIARSTSPRGEHFAAAAGEQIAAEAPEAARERGRNAHLQLPQLRDEHRDERGSVIARVTERWRQVRFTCREDRAAFHPRTAPL